MQKLGLGFYSMAITLIIVMLTKMYVQQGHNANFTLNSHVLNKTKNKDKLDN